MGKNLLLSLLMFFCICQVIGQKLYSNTVPSGFSVNPGLGELGTPRIFFDDVLIPSSVVAGKDSVNITSVTFGVFRGANAPTATINLYYTVVDDTATTINTVAKGHPVIIKTLALPPNGPTASRAIIYLGDSVHTLFKIKTDTGFLYPGYQTFFLGLSISDNSALNGWELTTPGAPESENADILWVYDVDRPQPRFASNFGGGSNPSATFYLEVFGGPNTVPVTLSEFRARNSGGLNLLNWTTMQEINTRYFVIEHSNNGLNFESIGQVNAAGNSNTIHHYSFADIHPAKGSNYYRLRTVDKDNSSELSNTCVVKNEGIADVSIYPNPSTDKITVTINTDKTTWGNMVITDASGKVVYSRPVKLPQGNTILPVEINSMAAGFYIMKLQLNNNIISRKFSKQ